MSMNVFPCTDSGFQWNDFELIPTVKMESGHPVEGSFGREFSSIYIVRELQRPEVGSRWIFCPEICLLKKTTLTGRFSKLFTDPRLVCKFREIWLTGSR